jgi:hypothetical protein
MIAKSFFITKGSQGTRGTMPLSLRELPCGHIITSRILSLVTAKILEEKRAYSTLFFHQEKSFHDHFLNWVSRL